MDGKTGCFACSKQPLLVNHDYLYYTFNHCSPSTTISRPITRTCMDYRLHDRVYCLLDKLKHKDASATCTNLTRRLYPFNHTQIAVCSGSEATNLFDAQEIFVVVFSCISLIMLEMCLFLLICCTKTSRPRRIDVMKHLFIAASIRVTSGLIYHILRIKSTSLQCDDGNMCKLLAILVEYGTSVECAWMLVLGFYHLLLSHGRILKVRAYLVLCLVTWFFPGIMCATWLVIMEFGAEECWCQFHFCNLIWMLDAPNILCLIIAAILLLTAWYYTNRPKSSKEFRLASNGDFRSAICFATIYSLHLVSLQILRVTDAYTLAFTHIRLTTTPVHVPDLLVSVSGVILSILLGFLDKEVCQICRSKSF